MNLKAMMLGNYLAVILNCFCAKKNSGRDSRPEFLTFQLSNVRDYEILKFVYAL